MSKRSDAIMTACSILSFLLALVSCVVAFFSAEHAAFLMVGACYLMLVSDFVAAYARGGGR